MSKCAIPRIIDPVKQAGGKYGMLENVQEDWYVYRAHGNPLRHMGFWVTLVYRFGHAAGNLRVPVIREIGVALYGVARAVRTLFCNATIPRETVIGKGLKLMHPDGIVILKGSVIGEYCSIFQQVTIGTGEKPGAPILKDHVVLFAGAKVLGPVTLGRYVHVGANAVVLQDVAERCTAVGVPARVITRNWQY
jgi:serine O-acetyltransferase